MTYGLGIDVGTSFTAAAVSRDGVARAVQLGQHGPAVRSAVAFGDDGGTLVGDDAMLRARLRPQAAATEFKRRIGSDTPVLVDGRPLSAERLTAEVLRWVVDKVVAEQGGPPAWTVVTHPANWAAHRMEVFAEAVSLAGLRDDVSFVSEPAAAATFYASSGAKDRGLVAVYDLGGGTFDAVVLKSSPAGFEVVGQPEGVSQLGGVDFDHALFELVIRDLRAEFDAAIAGGGTAALAATTLSDSVVAAKETLSTNTTVSVPLTLPSVESEVRVTRREFEAAIAPALDDSIVALERAIESAGITPAELDAVLLVGGSSRIPYVGELVTQRLGRPVVVDSTPKLVTALGAALIADPGFAISDEPAPAAAVVTPVDGGEPVEEEETEVEDPTAVSGPEPTGDPVPTVDLDAAEPDGRRRRIGAVLGLVVLVVVLGVWLAVRGGSDEPTAVAAPPPSTTLPTTTQTTVAPVETPLPSMAEEILGLDGFSILDRAVENSSLTDELAALEGQLTLFAPTDAALTAALVDAGFGPADLVEDAQVTDILLAHLVDGVVTVAEFEDTTVESRLGTDIRLGEGGDFTADDVVQADVMVANGVIHVVDRALIPASVIAALNEARLQELGSTTTGGPETSGATTTRAPTTTAATTTTAGPMCTAGMPQLAGLTESEAIAAVTDALSDCDIPAVLTRTGFPCPPEEHDLGGPFPLWVGQLTNAAPAAGTILRPVVGTTSFSFTAEVYQACFTADDYRGRTMQDVQQSDDWPTIDDHDVGVMFDSSCEGDWSQLVILTQNPAPGARGTVISVTCGPA